MKIVLNDFPYSKPLRARVGPRPTEGQYGWAVAITYSDTTRKREEAHIQPFEPGVGGWEAKTVWRDLVVVAACEGSSPPSSQRSQLALHLAGCSACSQPRDRTGSFR